MTPDHHVLARLPDTPPHWLHSYPAHLSRTWTLASGESLFVRPVRHDDGELEETFVRALSLESRYQRMLSGGTKVTPEWIDSMTHIDYHRHMAFAVTAVSDGVEQFVGVGRYVVDAVKSSAEVALVLADAWQGQGLGRRLLETLLEHAESAGIREAAGVVLATNVAMLGLVRSMGFTVKPEPGDATVRRISRHLRTVRATVSAQPH
jgi:acetyltransferase